MFVRQMVTPIIAVKNDPNSSIRSYVNNTLITIHSLKFSFKRRTESLRIIMIKEDVHYCIEEDLNCYKRFSP